MNTETQLFYISMLMATVGFVAGFLYRGGPSSEDQNVRIGDLTYMLKTARETLRFELAKNIALANVLIGLRDSWPTYQQFDAMRKDLNGKEADEIRRWVLAKKEYVTDALDATQLKSAANLFMRLNLSAGFDKIRPVIANSNKSKLPVNLDALHDFMVGAGPDKFTL